MPVSEWRFIRQRSKNWMRPDSRCLSVHPAEPWLKLMWALRIFDLIGTTVSHAYATLAEGCEGH